MSAQDGVKLANRGVIRLFEGAIDAYSFFNSPQTPDFNMLKACTPAHNDFHWWVSLVATRSLRSPQPIERKKFKSMLG